MNLIQFNFMMKFKNIIKTSWLLCAPSIFQIVQGGYIYKQNLGVNKLKPPSFFSIVGSSSTCPNGVCLLLLSVVCDQVRKLLANCLLTAC